LTNNDILRRLRYTFNLTDTNMIEIFAAADHVVTPLQVTGWLTKESEAGHVEPSDTELATFLNGFINTDRKSTRLNSSHPSRSRMPSSARQK